MFPQFLRFAWTSGAYLSGDVDELDEDQEPGFLAGRRSMGEIPTEANSERIRAHSPARCRFLTLLARTLYTA